MRYLLINFLRKMSGQIDEMVSVSKKISPDELNNSNVILDFADKRIVKCVIEGKEHDTTFDQMKNYYSRIYPTLIEQLERESLITASQEEPSRNKKRK